jgi:SAM-dependent methyltransferase
MSGPEFDRFSLAYEELVKDPIRDRFTGGRSVFFHERKRDLIRSYFHRAKRDTHGMEYLDVGCGRGELISLLRGDFGRVAGCDPSRGMLSSVQGVDTQVQDEPCRIPFGTETCDFVTAVCVFHHIPPPSRLALAREAARVLRPGGIFAVIEHNPRNPVTRRIVSRTPIDDDAILLNSSEVLKLMEFAGFVPERPQYFLYVPSPIYRLAGRVVERWLRSVPLGGQYALFGIKRGPAHS